MDNLLRLLLIEDSDDDAQLILREVKRSGFSVSYRRVEDAVGLKDALESSTWDIIICDYSLPHFSALDALEQIQHSGQDIPTLIISGTINEENAVSALKNGAHDFLTKRNLARLAPAIRRELQDALTRRAHYKAEKALEQSEERFRSWIEFSSDLVTVIGPTGLIRYVSPSSRRLLGYSPEELIGRDFLSIAHPEDHEVLKGLLDLESAPAQDPLTAEFRLHHKDETWHDFEGLRRIHTDSQGGLEILMNSREISERKQRQRELEAIASVSAALRSVETLEELLDRLLDAALSLIGVEAGNIWLYDADTRRNRWAAGRGWVPTASLSLFTDKGIPGLVLQTGETVVIPEFRTDPRTTEENRSYYPEGTGGACVPLRSAENIVGGMFIYLTPPREVTMGDVHVLNALAEIGGSAIHRMTLHEQTTRQLEQLSALRSIDIAISGSFDLQLSISTILNHVIRQLKIDAADVLLISHPDQSLKFEFSRGFRTARIQASSLHLAEGLAGQAALERRTVFIEDLGKEQAFFTRTGLIGAEGFVSYFAIPLIAKGRVQGVLEIFNRSPLHPTPEWLEFLENLASQAAIAIDNLTLFQELQRSNFELARAYDATIEGWSHALDLRDRDTEGHTLRVTEMTLRLARSMDMRGEELLHLRRGALLHDIGKMGVPDEILHKPGPLNEQEWEIMRRHPQYAYQMLKPISFLSRALDIPYAHHERWDGSGYPRGLKGDSIPVAARIFAVVDVWDALTSDRPYRLAWPRSRAVRYLNAQVRRHFDPDAVNAFLRVISGAEKDSVNH